MYYYNIGFFADWGHPDPLQIYKKFSIMYILFLVFFGK